MLIELELVDLHPHAAATLQVLTLALVPVDFLPGPIADILRSTGLRKAHHRIAERSVRLRVVETDIVLVALLPALLHRPPDGAEQQETENHCSENTTSEHPFKTKTFNDEAPILTAEPKIFMIRGESQLGCERGSRNCM